MTAPENPTPPPGPRPRRSAFFARNRTRAARLRLWRNLAFCLAAPAPAVWFLGIFIEVSYDWGYGHAIGLANGSVYYEWPSAAWVTAQKNAARPPAQPLVGFATGRFRPDFDFVSVSIKSGGPNSVRVGILLIAGVLFGVAGILHYRITRLRWHAGLCRQCFYDRAGLEPGAPCPECGAPANATPP